MRRRLVRMALQPSGRRFTKLKIWSRSDLGIDSRLSKMLHMLLEVIIEMKLLEPVGIVISQSLAFIPLK